MAPASLAPYRAKRDFSKTPEPAPEAPAAPGRRFVVQMHAATRLHWDFRLELDGVLVSWAVTRGPSADPADKRLAVRTEDHPIAYAEFEGTIPKGEYGGGTVLLWDEGEWTPHPGKDPKQTLAEGHLHFTLSGKRMKGEWILVRLKPRAKERQENWLLRKVADAHAGGDLAALHQSSIRSGRTLELIAAGKPARGRAGKATPPAFRPPMLATLVERPPAGARWLHEIKYDGYRTQIAVGGGRAIAYTRTGLDWSHRFAGIVAAAAALPCRTALLDGEVVALDGGGRSSFSLLQDRLKHGGELAIQLFDLVELDGEDLATRPLTERKARLKALLATASPPLLYSDHVEGRGEEMLAGACRLGLEGIISKEIDAHWRSGRSSSWLKVKCTRRQEFVVVGWLPSDEGKRGFRSLLLGVHDNGRLRYAGKVGTGFTQADQEALLAALAPLQQAEAPVEAPRAAVRGARWVAPRLVAEVAFAEWTADNVLRHASFLGLREDKPAESVTPERPALAAPPGISNADRLIFPEAGITKGMLAGWYERMAPYLLAEGAGRPLSLVRCPGGREKACFFQRHDAGGFGEAVKTFPDPAGNDQWLYVEDAAGLVAATQMGTIEFHGWGATVADLERPDRLVFDLDPDEGKPFADIVAAARDIRDQLAATGLDSAPMLSGGKGVHVIVWLEPRADWPTVKDFARRFALALEGRAPERYTASLSKARRRGRIFIDWLRNQRGSTSVLPWSVRARPHAPVAVPVQWEELDRLDRANRWTLADVAELERRARQPWGPKRQPLPDV